MQFSIKAKLDSAGVAIQSITESIAKSLYLAAANLARMTYNKAVELAGQKLHNTRQDYISALHMEESAPGVFVVYLDPKMNWVEDGMAAFPMLPKLAQGPKSKVAKDGHRYVVIPMKQSTSTKGSDNPKVQEFAADLKNVIKSQKFKTVRDGISPVTGKRTTVERLLDDPSIPKHLKGLTRVREFKQGSGKPSSSAYLTFRVASEKQDASSMWKNPGYAGVKIFPDLERWVDQQLDSIVADVFKKES
jgi:hypothetical protein